MSLRWKLRRPRVLVINPSGEESLGVPIVPLRAIGAKIEEVTTEEICSLLVSGPPSTSVKILPSLPATSRGYDLLIILGSPLGVLTHPAESSDDPQTPSRSLLEMERLVISFHAVKKPVLGLCLGSQIIARAFGGAVMKMPKDPEHTALPVPVEDDGQPRLGCEFGWLPLKFTQQAELDPVIGPALKAWRSCGRAPEPKFMQWHSDTFSIPRGAVPVASRPTCPSQVFRIGRATYAFQCHIEVGFELSSQWCQDYVEGVDSFAGREEWEPVARESARAMEAKFSQIVADGTIAQAEAFTHTLIYKLLEQVPMTTEDTLRLVAFSAASAIFLVAAAVVVRRRSKVL